MSQPNVKLQSGAYVGTLGYAAENFIAGQQKELLRMLVVQVVACLLMAGLLAGVLAIVGIVPWQTVLLSCLLGSGTYFLPNGLLACRLLLKLSRKTVSVNPLSFLLDSLIKIVVALLLCGLTVKYAREWLVWPAWLVGLLISLKAYGIYLACQALKSSLTTWFMKILNKAN